MKKTFLTSLLVVIIFSVFAQNDYTQTIRGQILDSQTEEPIVGAAVIITDSNPLKATVTDADGEFILKNITIGRQSVEISFIGYEPMFLRNLIIVSGKQTVLELKMEEKVVQIQNVVVKGTTNKATSINDMASVSARSFSVEETERYAGSLGDPSRMAANFAGVMSVADQRNDIVIRGNSPFGLLWRLDGIDVPNPNHFGSLGSTGGPVSMLNNNLLANSDFFTGAFPAEYGNALSGAFDINMRAGNNQKYEALGQVGFNGFEVGIEGPFSKKSKASFIANFRYSTLQLVNEIGIPVAGGSVPQYKDLTFKINVPRGKYGKLSIFGIGGLSYIEMLDSEGDDANYGYGGTDLRYGSDMAVVGLNHTYYINNTTRFVTRLSASGSRINTKLDSLHHRGVDTVFRFYGSQTDEIRYFASGELYKKINIKNNIKFGAKYRILNIYYLDSVYLDNFEKYVNQFDNLNDYMNFAEAFIQYQHKFSDDLTANVGVHAQYLFLNEDYAVEPRVGLQWKFLPKHSFNIGGGMHSQTHMTPLYFIELKDSITDVITQPLKDLKFSKAIHGVVGYDFFASQNFRIKAEGYYQHIYDVPITESNKQFSLLNTGDDFHDDAYFDLENKGTGTNYGLELTVEKFFNNNYYFLITTSLFESKYKGWDGIERNTKFNGNYVFNALAGYELQLGKKAILALDLKGVYAGGKRFIPIDVTESTNQGQLIYDREHAFESRHDDYFRINARLSFKLSAKHLSQEWAVDIQNITNQQNIYSQRWNSATNEIETDYQQGLFPMMTYRILF